jgi:crossover junction endodeoxyribonuclease RusA
LYNHFFVVYGEAIPKGSTRAFVVNGRAVTTNANKRTKDWQTLVSMAAQERRPDKPIEGAVDILINFYLPRPKSVSEKKRPLPIVRPDLDKLIRCVLDSLTGIYFKDDAQVCEIKAIKRYDETPRVEIFVAGHRGGDIGE